MAQKYAMGLSKIILLVLNKPTGGLFGSVAVVHLGPLRIFGCEAPSP